MDVAYIVRLSNPCLSVAGCIGRAGYLFRARCLWRSGRSRTAVTRCRGLIGPVIISCIVTAGRLFYWCCFEGFVQTKLVSRRIICSLRRYFAAFASRPTPIPSLSLH